MCPLACLYYTFQKLYKISPCLVKLLLFMQSFHIPSAPASSFPLPFMSSATCRRFCLSLSLFFFFLAWPSVASFLNLSCHFSSYLTKYWKAMHGPCYLFVSSHIIPSSLILYFPTRKHEFTWKKNLYPTQTLRILKRKYLGARVVIRGKDLIILHTSLR